MKVKVNIGDCSSESIIIECNSAEDFLKKTMLIAQLFLNDMCNGEIPHYFIEYNYDYDEEDEDDYDEEEEED